MDLEKLEEIGHAPLMDTLKEFGGWPVLEDEWDDSQFDWYVNHLKKISKAVSVQYFCSLLNLCKNKISLGNNFFTNSENMVTVRISSLISQLELI